MAIFMKIGYLSKILVPKDLEFFSALKKIILKHQHRDYALYKDSNYASLQYQIMLRSLSNLMAILIKFGHSMSKKLKKNLF